VSKYKCSIFDVLSRAHQFSRGLDPVRSVYRSYPYGDTVEYTLLVATSFYMSRITTPHLLQSMRLSSSLVMLVVNLRPEIVEKTVNDY
jgi:hypothetical protein